MENFFESIRAASAPDATAEARAEGVAACRAILAALGEPAPPPPSPPPIASMVAALRGVPPDQLLDLAIQRLRAALPAGVEVPPAQPLKFHIIPPPRIGGLP